MKFFVNSVQCKWRAGDWNWSTIAPSISAIFGFTFVLGRMTEFLTPDIYGAHWLGQACCKIYSHCLFQLVDKLLQTCSRLATSLMNSIALLQVTTCQQIVSNKLATTWQNNSIVTTCWQVVTSLLRTQLVDKLWDFYVYWLNYPIVQVMDG